MCQELHRRLATGLHVWAAHIEHGDRPSLMTEIVLNEPLRSPPAITREVQQSNAIGHGGQVHPYAVPPSPLPCDGPAPRIIVHREGQQGHSAGKAVDCEQCGGDAATQLHALHVGAAGREATLWHFISHVDLHACVRAQSYG